MSDLIAIRASDLQDIKAELAYVRRALENLAPKPTPMRVKDWAKANGVSKSQAYRMCEEQKINAKKIGGSWRIYP